MRFFQLITRIIDWFYFPVFRKYVPLQTFRYAACGGANMVLDLLLYYVVFHFLVNESNLDLGLIVISPHIAALLIVFPITFFNGFVLNKFIAFNTSYLKTSTQLVRYVLSVAGAIVLNYICMKIFVEALSFYPTPSKALTTAVSVVYSYLMQKYFTFREGSAD